MPAALLSARLTDKEIALRERARAGARPTLPDPAATTRALALAICEVEAEGAELPGLLPPSQEKPGMPPST